MALDWLKKKIGVSEALFIISILAILLWIYQNPNWTAVQRLIAIFVTFLSLGFAYVVGSYIWIRWRK